MVMRLMTDDNAGRLSSVIRGHELQGEIVPVKGKCIDWLLWLLVSGLFWGFFSNADEVGQCSAFLNETLDEAPWAGNSSFEMDLPARCAAPWIRMPLELQMFTTALKMLVMVWAFSLDVYEIETGSVLKVMAKGLFQWFLLLLFFLTVFLDFAAILNVFATCTDRWERYMCLVHVLVNSPNFVNGAAMVYLIKMYDNAQHFQVVHTGQSVLTSAESTIITHKGVGATMHFRFARAFYWNLTLCLSVPLAAMGFPVLFLWLVFFFWLCHKCLNWIIIPWAWCLYVSTAADCGDAATYQTIATEDIDTIRTRRKLLMYMMKQADDMEQRQGVVDKSSDKDVRARYAQDVMAYRIAGTTAAGLFNFLFAPVFFPLAMMVLVPFSVRFAAHWSAEGYAWGNYIGAAAAAYQATFEERQWEEYVYSLKAHVLTQWDLFVRLV